MKFYYKQDESEYTSVHYGTFKREFGLSPNGNEFNGSWVYRDQSGGYIDHDQYRTDLAERNNIILKD